MWYDIYSDNIFQLFVRENFLDAFRYYNFWFLVFQTDEDTAPAAPSSSGTLYKSPLLTDWG
jgi:hypothetical protein